MIKRYESYGEFLAAAKTARGKHSKRPSEVWYGNHTYSEALQYGANGDESLVTEAQALLDQLSDVDYGERTREFLPSVCGAYPIVPEYLAGHPLCMREPRESENLAPVSIYCCTTISAQLRRKQIMDRGIAILALVMKLQQIRPVNLYVTAETHGTKDGDYIQVIPIESRPLSIAHACYALTSTSFARRLTYTVAEQNGGFNAWAWGKYAKKFKCWEFESYYSQWLSGQLKLTDADMYIKPGHFNDELINSPVEWINTQLERYSTTN